MSGRLRAALLAFLMPAAGLFASRRGRPGTDVAASPSADRRVASTRRFVSTPSSRRPATDFRTFGSSDFRASRIRVFSLSIASSTFQTRCPR